jgi:hypothetical protein
MGIQNINGRRPLQEKTMIKLSAQEELQTLIEETTSALGATDQTYIRFLKLLQTEGKLSVPNRVMQGQLLFFKYQPISESFIASNKYYDKYPLVLVTEQYQGGFEGVNLHFLDLDNRKFLFDIIMRNLPVIKSQEEWRTRLRVDYDRLNASKRYKYFKPCYRRYLWKGMKKRPTVVPFEMWEDMVSAELHRFVKARAPTIHRQSNLKAIRGK